MASTGVLLCAVILMLPLTFLFGEFSNFTPSMESVIAIILLGAFPTAIAFVILYKLIDEVGAVFMTLVNYLAPCFGLLWGYFILSEELSYQNFMALIVITVGVMVTSYSKKTK